MDKKEIKRIADIIYNTYVLEGWKNVSMKDCTKQAVCYLETKDLLHGLGMNSKIYGLWKKNLEN